MSGSVGKRPLSPWVGWLLYGLFGVVVFVIALAATFPVGALTQRLVTAATQQTGWGVEVIGGKWAPLTGLDFVAVTATPPEGEPVTVRDVQLTVAPMALKNKRLELGHRADLYGGRLDGTLTVEGPQADPGFTWNGTLDDLALARVPLPLPGMPPAPWSKGLTLAGTLKLDGEAGWRGSEVARGNGRALVTVTDLVVQAANTPLGKLALPMGAVSVNLVWQRGRVDVEKLTLNGKVVRGEGSGRIMVGKTPQVSRVNLTFSATLGPEFPMRNLVVSLLKLGNDKVIITVKGTVARPVLYVNGKAVSRLMGGG